MNLRHLLLILIIIAPTVLLAQENGRTLPPNYRLIKKLTTKPDSPYFIDTLKARFNRCDTSLSVDDMRCIYYSYAITTLRDSYNFSSQSMSAWNKYQMILTAIWSTGNGSKNKPLHVVCREDAYVVAQGYDTPLWFKIKGVRKFKVNPLPPTAAPRR